MNSDQILLVDNDEAFSNVLGRFLTKNGFDVLVETTGERAIDRIRRDQPRLVILDVLLPGLDGLSICRSVRPAYRGPILIVTALAEDIDEVAGLETGADDYLTKPLRPGVLLARIRALLRRTSRASEYKDPRVATDSPSMEQSSASGTQIIDHGALHINASARSVSIHDRPVRCTSAEFDLLRLLAKHAGQVLSREFLQGQLRGLEYDGLDRTIDLRISKLRKKLGDNPRNPSMIKSVRGVGYILTP